MSKMPYPNQTESRRKNASVLLYDLWYHAPLTRAMLAQRHSLTKGTISAICRDLMALGLIRWVGEDRAGLGRPGRLVELDPEARCAVGVEISTNYTAAVLTDLCGKALWQRAVPHDVGSSQENVLSQAEALTAEAIDQARKRDALDVLLGIGVGVPGAVDPAKESVVTAPALGWKEVFLKQRLETRFDLPVIVDNKARQRRCTKPFTAVRAE